MFGVVEREGREVTDSVNESVPMEKQVAIPLTDPTSLSAEFEHQHVHLLYNTIADHFSSTRHTHWPKVERFVRELK